MQHNVQGAAKTHPHSEWKLQFLNYGRQLAKVVLYISVFAIRVDWQNFIKKKMLIKH